MKKVIVIALLFSYSIASFGVSLNYFYCCGKLKAVSLVANTEEKNCNAKSKKGCCDNKTVTIKLKVDQKSNNQAIYHFAAPLSPAIPHTDSYSPLNLATTCKLNPLYKRPPPDKLPLRHILYCDFRI